MKYGTKRSTPSSVCALLRFIITAPVHIARARRCLKSETAAAGKIRYAAITNLLMFIFHDVLRFNEVQPRMIHVS